MNVKNATMFTRVRANAAVRLPNVRTAATCMALPPALAVAKNNFMEVKTITIYSTVTCPYCKLLKDWLGKNKVDYKNIFVDQNDAAADVMIKKSGQMGVPVTEVVYEDGKNEIVVGFDKPKLKKLLGIKD